MQRDTIVASFIGGTNCRLQVFQVDHEQGRFFMDTETIPRIKKGTRAPGKLILKKTYQNCDWCCFEDVLRHFFKEARITKAPVSACFAVAGPVRHNVVRFTNRDSWEIDGDRISAEFHIKRVVLVNDFVALGYGLLTLDEATECVCLQDAPKQYNAPMCCIGAGTGLGQCFLTPVRREDGTAAAAAAGSAVEYVDGGDVDGSVTEYTCFPSEGGHAEFAPRSELEFGLLTFLKEKFDQKHRVSVERVVSGTGLGNVYEYFCTGTSPTAPLHHTSPSQPQHLSPPSTPYYQRFRTK